ncbi:hypothetical protein ABVK25_008633 [Lepraria finkii]|uniref:Uncharacterized protein n=1 Tax=Lepraria finkii TaxID=1340010 RepID=A0ABR4AZM5_9LECA
MGLQTIGQHWKGPFKSDWIRMPHETIGEWKAVGSRLQDVLGRVLTRDRWSVTARLRTKSKPVCFAYCERSTGKMKRERIVGDMSGYDVDEPSPNICTFISPLTKSIS